MDLIHEAIDVFNNVANRAFEGADTELEAIAEGILGKIFY